MSKRIIRSLMLAGAMVFSILLSSTQPAQADKSPSASDTPVYVGHITFQPKYHVSYNGTIQSINWLTQGTLLIYFDGKASGLNKISAVFDKSNIAYSMNTPADAMCTSTYYEVDAISDLNAESSTNFDTQEPSFTFPIKFGKAGVLEWQVTGNCKGTGEGGGTYTFPMIDGIASLMKTLKLNIYLVTEATLGGSCSLPGWDENSSPPYVYSEYCHWSAIRLPAKSPGAGQPDLAPLVPEWKRLK
jgi:hypothetical protein